MNSADTTHPKIKQLFSRINYERGSKLAPGDFKLSNMIRLLELAGNPHLDCPVIHVAGTKGKGSVTALISSILDAAGFKVGMYTSPHLERVNQRICVGNTEISDDELIDVLEKLDPYVNEIDRVAEEQNSKKLTFFEVITAAAFQHFADQKADVGVIEVGMGGRLDSTNVCKPTVCVITNISLDHTRQLGSTVEKIAAEKAGIIKTSVPVVSGVANGGPQKVINDVANELNARLIQMDRDFQIERMSEDSEKFSFRWTESKSGFDVTDVQTGMIGLHQQQNSAIAIAAIQQLAPDWNITESSIREGIASAFLPGRCEIAQQNPLIILDMAHNPASTTALAETLKDSRLGFVGNRKKFLVFATSKEKDAGAMLTPLFEIFDEIIVTKYQDNPRGMPINQVQKALSGIAQSSNFVPSVVSAECPEAAWNALRDRVSKADAICITGSAFLIAEMRTLLGKNLH